jgi:hypothetical protein
MAGADHCAYVEITNYINETGMPGQAILSTHLLEFGHRQMLVLIMHIAITVACRKGGVSVLAKVDCVCHAAKLAWLTHSVKIPSVLGAQCHVVPQCHAHTYTLDIDVPTVFSKSAR